MRRVLLVAVLVGLLVPATAEATIYRPLPAFTVIPGPCLDGGAYSCTWRPSRTIYWANTSGQTLQHEVGHLFDWYVMTDADRREYMRINHERGAWEPPGGGNSPMERFAEAYGWCKTSPRGFPDNYSTFYLYNPSPRRFQENCRFIRRVARTPWPPGWPRH